MARYGEALERCLPALAVLAADERAAGTREARPIRLEWGGKATAVAASGRQPDICFGEKKIELKLIFKHKDGREETRSIEVKRKD